MKLIKKSVSESIIWPVCNHECKDNVLSTYSITETAACFCPPSRNMNRYERLIKVISDLWKRNESYLVDCGNCSFKFGYPYIGGNEAFYSILHEQYGYPK